MWDDVLNNPKQCSVFREFRGELMIVGIEYDNNIERKVMNDTILGVASLPCFIGPCPEARPIAETYPAELTVI